MIAAFRHVEHDQFLHATALNPRAKRQTVTDAKRCLNCLSLDHFVRNCAFSSKCRICGPQYRNKHTGALHECYDGVNLGASDRIDQVSRSIPTPRNNCRESGSLDYTCRKLNSVDSGVVLLRTSVQSESSTLTRANQLWLTLNMIQLHR